MNTLIEFSTKFQNALYFKKLFFFFTSSKILKKILYLFLLKGWIFGFTSNKNKYKVYLKYFEKHSIIVKINSISTLLKKRFYVHKHYFQRSGLTNISTVYIISTSKGLFLSDDKNFLKMHCGGELLLKIQLSF